MFLKYISRVVLLISISPVHILNARKFEGNELEPALTKKFASLNNVTTNVYNKKEYDSKSAVTSNTSSALDEK